MWCNRCSEPYSDDGRVELVVDLCQGCRGFVRRETVMQDYRDRQAQIAEINAYQRVIYEERNLHYEYRLQCAKLLCTCELEIEMLSCTGELRVEADAHKEECPYRKLTEELEPKPAGATAKI